MKQLGIACVGLVLLAGCGGGEDGDAGAPGEDGSSCTVTDNGDGTATIACDDGTEATLSDGEDGDAGEVGPPGDSCTVIDHDDGTKTLRCEDGTRVTLTDGAPGVDGRRGAPGEDGAPGADCSAADNGNGTYTITCGTDSVTLSDGADGQDGANGRDGANGQDGTNGQDGADCSAADNGDGTYTITCGSDSVTLSDGADGQDGTNGQDGADCSAADNGDGTYTITCGSDSVTLSDGADGQDGADCSVADNGDGTSTVTCGTSSTVIVNGGQVTFGSGGPWAVANPVPGDIFIDTGDGSYWRWEFEPVRGWDSWVWIGNPLRPDQEMFGARWFEWATPTNSLTTLASRPDLLHFEVTTADATEGVGIVGIFQDGARDYSAASEWLIWGTWPDGVAVNFGIQDEPGTQVCSWSVTSDLSGAYVVDLTSPPAYQTPGTDCVALMGAVEGLGINVGWGALPEGSTEEFAFFGMAIQ